MATEEPRLMTFDRSARRLLIILIGLLAIIAVELAVLRPGPGPQAVAQIPDTGLQRKQLIDETRRTNELLEQIRDHLRHKTVKVALEQSDKAEGRKQGRAAP